MKHCPVCNTQVEDLYTGLCPKPDCTWEFEFVSEMTPEMHQRYQERLKKAKNIYDSRNAKHQHDNNKNEDAAARIEEMQKRVEELEEEKKLLENRNADALRIENEKKRLDEETISNENIKLLYDSINLSRSRTQWLTLLQIEDFSIETLHKAYSKKSIEIIAINNFDLTPLAYFPYLQNLIIDNITGDIVGCETAISNLNLSPGLTYDTELERTEKNLIAHNLRLSELLKKQKSFISLLKSDSNKKELNEEIRNVEKSIKEWSEHKNFLQKIQSDKYDFIQKRKLFFSDGIKLFSSSHKEPYIFNYFISKNEISFSLIIDFLINYIKQVHTLTIRNMNITYCSSSIENYKLKKLNIINCNFLQLEWKQKLINELSNKLVLEIVDKI